MDALAAAAPRFYELASEIIPILFIALLIEGGVVSFTASRDDPVAPRVQLFGWLLMTMTLAVLGEVSALHSVDVGHASSTARMLTILALIMLGIALVSGIFWRWAQALFSSAAQKVLLPIVLLAHVLFLIGATIYLNVR